MRVKIIRQNLYSREKLVETPQDKIPSTLEKQLREMQ
jgi:hypothetical protein